MKLALHVKNLHKFFLELGKEQSFEFESILLHCRIQVQGGDEPFRRDESENRDGN